MGASCAIYCLLRGLVSEYVRLTVEQWSSSLQETAVKVFISSVIKGFEAYREAAGAAIGSLKHRALRAEDFGARDSSSQIACLTGVRESDAVVLLLGERYGQKQSSGLSPTHEEFREARDSKPVLAFVQKGLAAEPDQQQFINEVGDWQSGFFLGFFSDPGDLRDQVTAALRDLEIMQVGRPLNEDEALARAENAMPNRWGSGAASLVISVASEPQTQVLRPGELNDDLGAKIQKEAMFGTHPCLDQDAATHKEIGDEWFWVRQEGSAVGVNQAGSVVMSLPAAPRDRNRDRTSMLSMAIVEEDIVRRTERALRFIGWLLDEVDPIARLTHVVPVAALVNADHFGWLTEAEAGANPSSMSIGMPGQSPKSIHLTPPARRRQELKLKAATLAEDLIVTLKRSRGR